MIRTPFIINPIIRNPAVRTLIIVTSFIGLLAGCVTVDPANSIKGDWQTRLHGFPVQLVITSDAIRVVGQEPVPYSFEGDTLIVETDDTTRIRVAFPNRNEMLQTNLSTGEVQRFTRSAKP